MLSWRCGIITVKFSFLKGLSQFAVMSVFINYEGPNLGKKQKRVVRSQAMVAVRGHAPTSEDDCRRRRQEHHNLESSPVSVSRSALEAPQARPTLIAHGVWLPALSYLGKP